MPLEISDERLSLMPNSRLRSLCDQLPSPVSGSPRRYSRSIFTSESDSFDRTLSVPRLLTWLTMIPHQPLHASYVAVGVFLGQEPGVSVHHPVHQGLFRPGIDVPPLALGH